MISRIAKAVKYQIRFPVLIVLLLPFLLLFHDGVRERLKHGVMGSQVISVQRYSSPLLTKESMPSNNAYVRSHENVQALVKTTSRQEITSRPSQAPDSLKPCTSANDLVGPLYVEMAEATWAALEKDFDYVRNGGHYFPLHCKPVVKTAIIIPYRDRESHLKTLLLQIYPMLKRQNIFFQIFVIEQADSNDFNRGKLMNVGFREALKITDFNCFVFHDVDLIPEDDRNHYGCHISPAHLSAAVDKFHYELIYYSLFGGVEMFKKEDFEKVNGFSNIFWGWGAEDDNLYQRITKHNFILRRPSMAIGRYKMIKHDQAPGDNKMYMYNNAHKVSEEDGLNSLEYKVMRSTVLPLYTKISVDLLKEKEKEFIY